MNFRIKKTTPYLKNSVICYFFINFIAKINNPIRIYKNSRILRYLIIVSGRLKNIILQFFPKSACFRIAERFYRSFNNVSLKKGMVFLTSAVGTNLLLVSYMHKNISLVGLFFREVIILSGVIISMKCDVNITWKEIMSTSKFFANKKN